MLGYGTAPPILIYGTVEIIEGVCALSISCFTGDACQDTVFLCVSGVDNGRCGETFDSVRLLSGVLGIKVKIMLPWDPSGKNGPRIPLPDHVSVVEPKDEKEPTEPYSVSKVKPGEPGAPPVAHPPPVAQVFE